MPRALLSTILLLASCATCRPTVTTVYLVRHAEKATVQGDDPNLTGPGHARARALAAALDGLELDAVYATQYRRTVQTVKPTADARAASVEIIRAQNTHTLVERVTKTHRGRRVLVAGHSNTVPELMRALGVHEEITLNSKDYGDLFVVTITADGSATLERRRFDP